MTNYTKDGALKVSVATESSSTEHMNLGQVLPVSGVLTTLYAVPSSHYAKVARVLVCNQSSFPGTFRLSFAIAAAADSRSQYLYYDVPVPARRTFEVEIDLRMSATDVLRVWTDSHEMSFNAWGEESES